MIKSAHQINNELAEAFGLPTKDLMSFELKVSAGHHPVIHARFSVRDVLESVTKRYELGLTQRIEGDAILGADAPSSDS